MNYYNPYYFMNPVSTSSPSLFSGLLGRSFSFGSLLDGAQRTLGLVNQALPLIKEAAPMMRNAKTMFKVMNEFKKMEAPSNNSINVSNKKPENTELNKYNCNNGGPTFFV